MESLVSLTRWGPSVRFSCRSLNHHHFSVWPFHDLTPEESASAKVVPFFIAHKCIELGLASRLFGDAYIRHLRLPRPTQLGARCPNHDGCDSVAGNRRIQSSRSERPTCRARLLQPGSSVAL